MRNILIAAALVLVGAVRDDDTYTVTLTVKSMHCDDCRKELEASLKRLPGFKSLEVNAEGLNATVTVLEKSGPKLKTIQPLVPGDMKLEKVGLSIRGWGSAAGTLKAKGSKEMYDLAERDPKKDTKVADLKKAAGAAEKKFRIVGELAMRDKKEVLIVDSFEAADWKDE